MEPGPDQQPDRDRRSDQRGGGLARRPAERVGGGYAPCMPAADPKIRLAVVGTGDVAYRHYLPTFESLADEVAVTAFVDPRPGAAERAVGAVAAWSPGAKPYLELDAMLGDHVADAAVNLSPAPRHGPINAAILEAGLHLYSEKPLAASVAEADALIALAQ